jgi:hypothetical protein
LFSDDIVVSHGNRLYDGTPEDIEHIHECKRKFPSVKFVEYDVDMKLDLNVQKGVQTRPAAYWHNLARWTAVKALEKREWVFVIDADEIPEGLSVKRWLETVRLDERECYKIATFWYFKETVNQASMLEDSILLIHHKHLTDSNIFGDYERDHLIHASGCKLNRLTKGVGGEILWKHYSWVRPRHALLHKIKNWGHSSDIFKNVDAEKLVDYIFRNSNVNDVVHGYSYKTVPNRHNITF